MAAPRRRQPEWVVVEPGVERQMISAVGGTEFSVYRLAGGRRFGFHAHPYAEMGVMVSGGGLHRMRLDVPNGGRKRSKIVEIVARRGDCFYVPPNVPHSVETFPGRPTVCVDLILDGTGAGPDVAVPPVPARARPARRPRARRNSPGE